MAKKTVRAIEVRGQRVLARLDLNVPMDDRGRITDDRRIRAALPTITHLLDGGARVFLMSHLGRPIGDPIADKRLTLAPVAVRLAELLGRPVTFVPDCVGPYVFEPVVDLADGDCCLLENLRFHKAETIKDKNADGDSTLREAKTSFARQLADLADVYVNDAFGTCHRDNASMLTVPRLMAGKPRVIGFLIERELKFLGEALAEPPRPFVAILGGAKVSDKIGVIDALLSKCDCILIGGAMTYTFLAAQGVDVGRSLCEPDAFDTARRLRAAAGDKLRLPVDSVVAAELKPGIETRVCDGAIPDGSMGLDIGPRTLDAYAEILSSAGTVLWNGPMGVFEIPPFERGTMEIAHRVAEATDRGAITIIGGGDSAAAVDQAGLADRMTHISTGGGASLEYLEGKPFRAIEVLDNA